MEINGIDPLFPVSTPTETTAAKKTLDKDDFLKLFITQLVHQNPMEPINNDQFIAQMAQFSAVEQATNTATTVARMLTAQEETNELLAMMLYHQMGSVSRTLYESSGMIGLTIIAQKEGGNPMQGKVARVILNGGEVEVLLENGSSFYLGEILEISR
ncbi:MAG: hypothetical protein FWE76_08085 [Symbiobacteriaceae bacterium]|nr:hypothetical protein [Symbiobacteriaceae bacterium]